MHDARRYRVNAAECVLAAQEARLITANFVSPWPASWLSLARQDEDNLLASWEEAEPEKVDGLGA